MLTNAAKRDLAETSYVLQEKEESEDSDDDDAEKPKSRPKRAGASTVGLAEEDGRLRSARLREQYQANKVAIPRTQDVARCVWDCCCGSIVAVLVIENLTRRSPVTLPPAYLPPLPLPLQTFLFFAFLTSL